MINKETPPVTPPPAVESPFERAKRKEEERRKLEQYKVLRTTRPRDPKDKPLQQAHTLYTGIGI